MFSACSEASVRTRWRPPFRRSSRTNVPSGHAAATYTRPTGFCGVPPPGPATPVVETATSAPLRARRPSAISRAQASLTAPKASSVSGRTPR